MALSTVNLHFQKIFFIFRAIQFVFPTYLNETCHFSCIFLYLGIPGIFKYPAAESLILRTVTAFIAQFLPIFCTQRACSFLYSRGVFPII